MCGKAVRNNTQLDVKMSMQLVYVLQQYLVKIKFVKYRYSIGEYADLRTKKWS